MFLENLDYLLKSNNMSRSDLAKAVKISSATITLWYKGNYENISLSILRRITNYFNITLDDLVDNDLSKEKIDLITLDINTYSYKELALIKDIIQVVKDNREERI